MSEKTEETDESGRDGPRCEQRLVRHSFEVESLAFEGPKEPDRGYTVKAYYLAAPHNLNALVEIYKDGEEVRHFLFPAYKIWNVPAHFTDIVDGEIEKSTKGYEMAAWDGISGATVIQPNVKRSDETPINT